VVTPQPPHPAEPWLALYEQHRARAVLRGPPALLRARLDVEAALAFDRLAADRASIAEVLTSGASALEALGADAAGLVPAVVRALTSLVHDASKPLTPTTDLEGLRAWAAEHHVTPLITSGLVQGNGRSGEAIWMAPDPHHRSWLKRHLEQVAADVERAEREEAQDRAVRRATPPTDPQALELVEALERLRDELRRDVLPVPLQQRPRVTLTVAVKTTQVSASLYLPPLLGQPSGHGNATLHLAGAPLLRGTCTCSHRCSHILVLIDAVLGELHALQPTSPLTPLLERLRVPAWQRLVSDLDALQLAREERPTKPLAWLFINQGSAYGPGPQLSAHEERVNKSGVRALNTAVAVEALLARRVADDLPADHAVLELLAAESDLYSPNIISRMSWATHTVRQAALALVGHPRVWITDARYRDAQPLEVHGATLQVRAVELPGGVRLEPHVDGVPVDAQSFVARIKAGVWLQLDRERRVLKVARIEREARRLAETLAATPAVVPAEARAELLRRLPRIERHLPVARTAGLRGEPVAPSTAVVVCLAPHHGPGAPALAVTLRVRPVEGGPRFAPGDGPVTVHGSRADGTLITAERDLAEERQVAQALLAQVPALVSLDLLASEAPRVVHGEDAIALVAALQAEGDAVTVEWPKPDDRWRVRRTLGAADLRLEVLDRDWFGIAGGVDVDDERLRLEALLEAVREERRFVRLRGDDWVAVDSELRGQLRALDEVLREGRGGLEIGPAGPALLRELGLDTGRLDTTARWRELEARISAAATLERDKEPEAVPRSSVALERRCPRSLGPRSSRRPVRPRPLT
jgi:hypothetical protein